MTTRYRIFKSLGEDCRHLTYLGEAVAASPKAAARAFFPPGSGDVPEHLAIIPDRGVHYLPAAMETQTRLRIG